MTRLISLLALLVIGCAGCLIPDADQNGVIVFGCLGDSRTAPGFLGITSWCERLPALHLVQTSSPTALPDATDNFAVPGVQVTVVGLTQTASALAAVPPADSLLVAFGFNDVYYGKTTAQIIAAEQAIVDAAPGQFVFVATTPPAYVGRFDQATVNRLNKGIDALNAAIRATFSAWRVIDFDTGFTEDLYQVDGVHLTDAGEQLMAERVIAALDR